MDIKESKDFAKFIHEALNSPNISNNAYMHLSMIENKKNLINKRLKYLCEKLKVKYENDVNNGLFYFDKRKIYGNNLCGKDFIKPIYEYIYNEKLIW